MQARAVDTPTADSSRRSLRRLYIFGALFLIALVVGIQVEGLRQSYRQYQDHVRLNAQNLGNVLTENIAGAFQNIDLTLLAAIDRLQLQHPRKDVDERNFDAALSDLKRRVPWLVSLRVIDASGEVVFGKGLEGAKKTNLGDRDYFQRLKLDPNAGLVIAKPIISRFSNTWILTCARRFNLPNGDFGGVVYGTVEIDGLAQRLIGKKIQLGDRDILTLRDNDGNVIVRYIQGKQDMQIMGQKVTSQQSSSILHSNADSGFYTTQSTIDGIERVFYFRRVDGQALNLVVGLSMEDALADWRSEAFSAAVIAVIFALITAIGSVVLYRSRLNNLLTLIKLEEARREAEQARIAAEGKSRQVGTLLDNSGQGFLSFGADLRIEAEYSDECRRIFTDEAAHGIAGAFLPALLHAVDDKQRADVENNLRYVFACADEYLRELYLGLLPGEYQIRARHYEAQYRFLNDGKMMLILTDVSDEKALQEKIRQEQLRIEFLVTAMENRNSLLDTLDAWREFETKNLPALLGERAAAPQPQAALTEIHREIHTYKGLFAQEGLPSMPQVLHRLEDRLARLIASGTGHDLTLENLRQACEVDLKVPLEADLNLLREKLGAHYFAAGKLLQVPVEVVDQLEIEVNSAFSNRHVDKEKLLQTIHRLRHQPLSGLLEPHFKAAAQLAMRLHKELASIRYEGDEIQVDPRPLLAFCKSLVHVFRNCVDHGVEDAETRFDAGKAEAGRIHCRAMRQGENILLCIGDDGRGLDRERICARAVEQGLLSADAAAMLDEPSVFRLIFADGLSTRDQVSEISGRGVGLAATLQELNKLGGTVEIVSATGVGTEFRFTWPLNPRQATPNGMHEGAPAEARLAHDHDVASMVTGSVSVALQRYLRATHGIACAHLVDGGDHFTSAAEPCTTVLIHLGGRIDVMVALSFEQDLLQRLWQDEVGGAEISDDQRAYYQRETAAEIANIVLGHSLANLSDQVRLGTGDPRITLSPPVVAPDAGVPWPPHEGPTAGVILATSYGKLAISAIEPQESHAI